MPIPTKVGLLAFTIYLCVFSVIYPSSVEGDPRSANSGSAYQFLNPRKLICNFALILVFSQPRFDFKYSSLSYKPIWSTRGTYIFYF